MSNDDITVIGETNFRGERKSFGILSDDRRRHVYVLGKTGVGKTTFLENMIRQDIESGKGVALVDPHGDLADSLLDAIPPERVNDVIYFNPADTDYPVAFNVLEAVDPAYKYLISSGLIGSLKKIWADSWGPRLEYILRNTILALLDYPQSTMLGILRMLGDGKYRKKVVDYIQDPVVKAFWTDEFANYNERFRAEAVSPIQNKVGQFLTSSIIRNIVAQPKSTIDMKDIMDNKKILLINASKGKIGEDNSALLGAMIITRIQLAAMDRAHIPEEERQDFYLYVDEFQNFATESFATILSEARKYRLNLTIAHQYVTQMEEEVRDAVFGNTGTLAIFRIGATDGEYLEKEFAPVFTETDLINLDKYNAYIKLMIDGITSKPFSMRTIEPSKKNYGKREQVIKVSRERYGRKREIVEEKIARWSGVIFEAAAAGGNKESGGGQPSTRGRDDNRRDDNRRGDNRQKDNRPSFGKLPPLNQADTKLQDTPLPKPREEITDLASILGSPQDSAKHDDKVMEKIVCDRCGKDSEVPFKPTPGKPVYCKECLAIVREEKRQEQAKLPSQDSPGKAFSGPKPPGI